jgi:hypothetical protein
LRHFRSRDAAFAADAAAPEVAFPPDGAEVELLPEGLMVQVSGGTAPFTWLADGAPVMRVQQDPTAILPVMHNERRRQQGGIREDGDHIAFGSAAYVSGRLAH